MSTAIRNELRKAAVLLAIACALLTTGPPGAAQAEGSGDEQPLISNVFLDTDIRTVLQDIAQQAGVHIVPDESVQGNVSLDLKDVPLEQALGMVLMSGGYAFRKLDPTCYLVGSCAPDSPTFNLLSTTAVIPLRHIKVEGPNGLPLSDYYKDYVKVDAKSNTVIVTGPKAVVERVAADIALLDRARSQVRIEAVIADVKTDRAREFLNRWRLTEGVAEPENTRSVFFENLVLGYTSLHMREVLLAVRALLTNGIANIRAQPSVSTLDGEEARIFVGKEEYFSILSGGTINYPYYRLESIKSGIALAVLPRIVGDDLITLQCSPEVSDVVARGDQGLPVVSRRTVTTTVRVRSGETVVVGGLTSELVRKTRTGVPVLRDIPIIGSLFSTSTSTNERTELLILLTPHIIRTPGLTAVEGSAVLPGAGQSGDQQSRPSEPQLKPISLDSDAGAVAGVTPPTAPVPAPVEQFEAQAQRQSAVQSAETAAAAVRRGTGEVVAMPRAAEPVASAPQYVTDMPLAAPASPPAGQSTASGQAEPAIVPGPAGEPGAASAPTDLACTITQPSNGSVARLGERIRVALSVAEGTKLSSVILYVNGRPRGLFGNLSEPYVLEVDTARLRPGLCTLQAVGVSTDGKELQSQLVQLMLSETS